VKQIPEGNDSHKGKGNSKSKDRSRFPEGMTKRRAKAKAEASAFMGLTFGVRLGSYLGVFDSTRMVEWTRLQGDVDAW
jgi:hypothetical protein